MKASILFDNAINHWKENKGVGTALIPPPLDDRAMLLGILQKVYIKHPNINALIIVNNFTERKEIIEFLTQQEDEENNAEFKRLIQEKKIKVFTTNFIDNENYKTTPGITFLYHCESLSNNVYKLISSSVFRLVILNRLRLSNEDITKLYAICPMLSDFKQNEIDELRTSTPVEEMRIGVTIPPDSEAYALLQYYDEYITTSLNIFGSFENIKYARVGFPQANISATQFCHRIATDNGWDANLDMSVEINVQIDNLYNPANIRDRAMKTYEIIRNRTKLLTDYEGKLDKILDIVKEHSDKHILIINKFGEFAAKVTAFINNNSESDICGNYHDRVDPIPATTIDGTPLFVKSGANAGERRMFAAKAQKNYNQEKFKLGYINVLSANNTPDKDLNIPVDVIIITSPLSEDIESYIYRLANVYYPSNKILLYSLYIRNSIEDKRLLTKPISETHILVQSDQENEKNDENFDFVVAD